MSALKRIVYISIICLVFESTNAEIRTAWEKNVSFPNTELYYDFKSFHANILSNYNKFVYMLCKTSEDKTEKTCNLVLETKGQLDKSCNVTLKITDLKQDYNYQNIKMMHKKLNKVVLIWVNGYNKIILDSSNRTELEDNGYGESRISIVDLNSCESQLVAVTKFHYSPIKHWWGMHILNYADSTFDVVELDYNKGILKISTIDKQIKATLFATQLNPFNLNLQDANAFLIITPFTSNSEGFLLQYRYPTNRTLLLVKNNETMVLVNKTKSSHASAFSTSYKTIGYVSLDIDSNPEIRKTVFINQFDQEGNSKFNKTLKFGYSVTYIRIHNLANGGFLLLTGEHIGEYQQRSNNRYHVIKYGANGEHQGELYIGPTEFSCSKASDYPELRFFENETKEYCLYKFCINPFYGTLVERKADYIDIKVKCFSDQDFTVS